MNVRAFKLRPIADFIRRGTATRLGWGALASLPGLAFAGPGGENVVGGAAVISRPNATHTQVDQSTQNAIVNWQTFSVDSDEYVIFNQPGTTSSILNRVVGSQQSSILGQIQANGRVYLVNPQGIYFAQGSKVDVGSFTASTLGISNNDFMSGNYVFTRSENAVDGATVENAGEISVADGGYVVLAGDYANNTGVISARLGSVVLAAGNQMTLELSNDGLVSFAVDEATVSDLAGAKNSGQILADGGQIIMTAKVANDLVATAVNNDGLLQAHRVVEQGGEIYLTAAGGDIVHTGTIDANAEAGQSGGRVDVLSDENITLTADSVITANGDGAGNGGVVNVIADGTLAFRSDADIVAVAGDSGSRGGAVEVSGHGSLVLRGNVSVGAGGEVLVDPGVVKFSAGTDVQSSGYGASDVIGTQWVEGQLNVGTNVIIRASNEINAASGGTGITASGFGDLTLRIAGSSGSTDSTGDINLPGFNIDINGSFNAYAGTMSGDVILGQVTAGNVDISAGIATGDITLTTGGISAASSNLSLNAPGGDITIAGGLFLSGSSSVGISVFAGSDVNISGDIIASGSYGGAVISGGANNFNARDVIAYASNNDASVDIRAVNNIMVRDVEAEIGSISSSGSGRGSIFLSAGNNVTARDLEARGGSSSGTADIDVSAGNNIVVRDATAIAFGTNDDASISFDAVNHITAGNLTVIANGSNADADIDFFTSSGNIVTNNVTTSASNGSVFLELDAGNNLTVNGMTTGVAMDEFSISYSAGNVVTINGSMDVTALGSSYVEVEIDGDNGVVINAPISVTGNNAYASFDISAWSGNVAINSGMTATATGSDSAYISVYANGSITINGPTIVSGSAATLSLSASGGNLNVNGTVDVSAQSSANFYGNAYMDGNILGKVTVDEAGSGYAFAHYQFGGKGVLGETTVSGHHAELSIYADALTVNGPTTILAQSSAGLFVNVVGDLNVLGDVTISEAGSGFASASYEYGNNGTFGKHTITGHSAFAGFGSAGASAAKTATFTKPVVVNGTSFGFLGVGVRQSIKTTGAGLLQADVVSLLVSNNGTTTIDAKTKTPLTNIQNVGLTPNVRLDNRAFTGPSVINFGPGAVLKSATFLASGSLTVDGPFSADRLAVGVTNGSVTFADQVYVSGANSFPFTAPDAALFTAMGLFGLNAPNHGPNVQILAKSGININNPFIVDGPSPFTKMFTNGPFNISGLTTPGDNLLAVFSPINLDRSIIFNNTPSVPPVGTSAFFNFPTIQHLPNSDGVTIVLGELGPAAIPLLSGSVTIGQNGSINIGSRNMFIISRGDVSGDDLVSTSGIFEIIGVAETEFFQVPTVQDFVDNNDTDDGDDDDDDTLALGDGDDDGGDESEVSEESDSQDMECS